MVENIHRGMEMNQKTLEDKTKHYIETLCTVQPNRRTGSKGNKQAITFFNNTIQQYGFKTDTTPFKSLDYICTHVSLQTKEKTFNIHVSPYSLGCNVKAELVIVRSLSELERCSCKGKILLMKDEICEEQLMPKNFVFYNPKHHKKIISVLENKKPAAIITATTKKPDQVGALYPFPLIEDGDFNIPNVFCTEKTGEEIVQNKNETFTLVIDAERIPTTASNVIAIKNPDAKEKIIICAHIDAYGNSPGASDNASGTAVLLLLAELLESYNGSYRLEIIAFNGEDHYTVGGQMDYLKRYGSDLKQIRIAINIDDVGYKKGRIAYSLYEINQDLAHKIQNVFDTYNVLTHGESWYQGDHMIFVQQHIPSIAITSENYKELMSTITHTQNDTPEHLDYQKILELAKALKELIQDY